MPSQWAERASHRSKAWGNAFLIREDAAMPCVDDSPGCAGADGLIPVGVAEVKFCGACGVAAGTRVGRRGGTMADWCCAEAEGMLFWTRADDWAASWARCCRR